VSQTLSLTITARNREQAGYLVRSRAQQRGVAVDTVDVTEAGPGVYVATVTVEDADAATLAAAALDEDTQVLHLRTHPRGKAHQD
jgi:hypothetical protein